MSARLAALVLLLAACAAIALGVRGRANSDAPATTKPPHIVFVTGGSNAYWQMTAKGAEAAAKNTGADVEILMPEQDENVDEQIRLLLNIDRHAIDGVAISPLDAEQQTRLINRLSEDAMVVTFDSDAPLSARMNYIGASNLAAGQQAAGLMKEALPNGGKVAVLVANLTKNNTKERVRGFEEVLTGAESGPDFEIVAVLVDNGADDVARQKLQKLLADHEDLAGIVGMNAQHAPILLATLREAGRLDGVKLVTFDDLPETLQGVEDGEIFATIAQDPYHYGFEAVRSLTKLHAKRDDELPIPGSLNTVTIGTQAVRQANVEEFRRVQKELAGEKG